MSESEMNSFEFRLKKQEEMRKLLEKRKNDLEKDYNDLILEKYAINESLNQQNERKKHLEQEFMRCKNHVDVIVEQNLVAFNNENIQQQNSLSRIQEQMKEMEENLSVCHVEKMKLEKELNFATNEYHSNKFIEHQMKQRFDAINASIDSIKRNIDSLTDEYNHMIELVKNANECNAEWKHVCLQKEEQIISANKQILALKESVLAPIQLNVMQDEDKNMDSELVLMKENELQKMHIKELQKQVEQRIEERKSLVSLIYGLNDFVMENTDFDKIPDEFLQGMKIVAHKYPNVGSINICIEKKEEDNFFDMMSNL